MWKFIWFPLWRYELIERKLEELEQRGLRVETVCLFWLFKFKVSEPKTVRYIFTYTFPKDWGMIDLDINLKRYYRANPIKSRCLFSWNLYRITDITQEVEVGLFRRKYIQGVLLKKAMLSFSGVVFGLACCEKLSGTFLFRYILLMPLFMAVMTLYYLFGFSSLYKNK